MAKKEKVKKEKAPKNPEIVSQVIKAAAAVICTASIAAGSLSSVDRLCSTNLEIASTKSGASSASVAYESTDLYEDNAEYTEGDSFEGAADESGEEYDVEEETIEYTSADGKTVTVKKKSKNGNSKKEKYNGPLLKNGVIPFDFSKVNADPSKWTMQEIVDCYKSGMAKADVDGVQTDMVFQLVGDLPGFASALKGPVNLAMRLGAQPYDALTGGYWDLEPSDLKKADAHKEGDYVVINLYPREQVDGPNGDEHKGTVGHVVNVVQGIGDFIAYVEENYGILHAYYEDDSIVLKYPDAYAKNIKINTKTGKMESGTWGYDVEIYLDHCGVLGVDFHNFHTAVRWKCWFPVVD